MILHVAKNVQGGGVLGYERSVYFMPVLLELVARHRRFAAQNVNQTNHILPSQDRCSSSNKTSSHQSSVAAAPPALARHSNSVSDRIWTGYWSEFVYLLLEPLEV